MRRADERGRDGNRGLLKRMRFLVMRLPVATPLDRGRAGRLLTATVSFFDLLPERIDLSTMRRNKAGRAPSLSYCPSFYELLYVRC